MPSSSIDYGIDLGTTNSAIAVWRDGGPIVIENNESSDTTPSAVWLDRGGLLQVGTRRAFRMVNDDPDNAFGRFKRQMGTNHVFRFARDGREMTPEELSTEVLKALRADVMQRRGDDVQAAVITVPADFDLAQNDATRRAAEGAGIRQVILLQEPVAASLAYGDAGRAKRPWLVYDLGGGTFDAAIVESRDGELRVINHAGKKYLGGSDIDRSIVEEILLPRLCAEVGLSYRLGDEEWKPTIGALTFAAELTKIALSRQELAWVDIEPLPLPGGAEPDYWRCPLTRSEVAEVAMPLLLETVKLSRQAIDSAGLTPDDIERVLLVGGPTLAPYLRELLLDPEQGLGIELALDEAPMTIVARGAAIYASQQLRYEPAHETAQSSGVYQIDLQTWKPAGPDFEFDMAGKVQAPDDADLSSYEIQFERGGEGVLPWSSGRKQLSLEGAFMVTLLADTEHISEYTVRLFTPSGQELPVKTSPSPLTYRVVDLAAPAAPLTHNIGVALRDDRTFWFSYKGDALPARSSGKVHQAAMTAGDGDGAGIVIPVIEGTRERASENTVIGTIEVPGDKLPLPIPPGSEIEVTIEIDASRLLTAKAYVPILDKRYEMKARLLKAADPSAVVDRAAKALQRLDDIRGRAEGLYAAEAQQVLHELDASVTPDKVKRLAAEVRGGETVLAQECLETAQELEARLNEAEDAMEWPSVEHEAQRTLRYGEDVARRYGNAEERAAWAEAAATLVEAIETRDVELVKKRDLEAYRIAARVLDRVDVLPIQHFNWLVNQRDRFTEPYRAAALIEQGGRARANDDIPTLRAVVRQLFRLLPPDQASSSGGSTVVKRSLFE